MWTLSGTYNLRRAAHQDWLYRSATLDQLESVDFDTLRANDVGLVVDLREERERPSHAASITTIHIPIYDLPDGPPQLGSITSIYELMLFDRGHKLAVAVSTIAQADAPVLVHCTAGKDRTGLVVALTLLASGVDESAIIDDYAASGHHVRPRRHALVAESLASLDLSGNELSDAFELHLDSPATALESALAEVRVRFGSITNYLLAHGVTTDEITMLVDRRMAHHA
ncbi:tyrosine-protein phosphatase [Salinibacterium sp. NG22]|uniref:tyrosine-protein phosphatase n=1 Tax=Salinibacterium sp. NG22 TaxID=2792040 RepID=UPI0018CCF430|nr:tyrosine-protein phosphatase [Salinibacterium sp. NG22]MBH0109294.1 tyrosine-protein phosphatase [Salinibacterium sp. NG22]